jgi:hypothetical protein
VAPDMVSGNYKMYTPYFLLKLYNGGGGRRGRDGIVVGFTTTYAISTYYLTHWGTINALLVVITCNDHLVLLLY